MRPSDQRGGFSVDHRPFDGDPVASDQRPRPDTLRGRPNSAGRRNDGDHSEEHWHIACTVVASSMNTTTACTVPAAVRIAALLGCAALAACRDDAASGSADGQGSDDAGTSGEALDPSSCASAPQEPVRRLSAFEYIRALRDLLAVDIDEVGLPPSSVTTIFATEDAALGSSALLVDGQFDATSVAAEAVLARFTAGEGAAFMGCEPDDPTCFDGWLDDFGARAHRRPLADDEHARLRSLYDEIAAPEGPSVAVAATVQALLLSPRFGFHTEERTPDGALDGYSIAARLSFLLWSSIPDDELFAAAADGSLADPAERATQAERMLADPRARQSVVRAYRELLDLDEVAGKSPTDDRWSDALRTQIDTESDRFIEATLFDGDGTLSALLTSPWVDAGPELAALYGIDPGADELPAERAGLLTRAGFLVVQSSGTSPSPVLRGLAVLGRFQCTEIAPPPATVPDIAPAGDSVTNRDRYEVHTLDPSCSGCHSLIDPIGFTFENFDALGAYRTTDNGQPVDASGSVFGSDVVGAAELSAVLAASDEVSTCAVTQWLRFTLGHELDDVEACVRDELAARFIASGGDVRLLLVDLASSELFVQ